ncbi:cell surface glycoprotein 1-like isoform X1 [Lytechinus variegatus]|uniref:cell surface glycoprotein 1-like isoform X1 n=2 Tax=Lytechinus variegatus TaxID=7654 RepID=UPI001BB18751|nr:cell surface glycoprotein 1-like isoform X1 [Lytechinus variegatus]
MDEEVQDSVTAEESVAQEQPDIAPPTDAPAGAEQDMDNPSAGDLTADGTDFPPPPPPDSEPPPEPESVPEPAPEPATEPESVSDSVPEPEPVPETDPPTEPASEPTPEIDDEANDVTDLIDSAVDPEIDEAAVDPTTENEIISQDEESQAPAEVTVDPETESPVSADGNSTPPPMYDEAPEAEKPQAIYQNSMVAEDTDGITTLDEEVPNGHGVNGDLDPIIMMYSNEKTSSTRARLICFVMFFIVVAITVIALTFYLVLYYENRDSSDSSEGTVVTTPRAP